jgi:hypothetical protein
MTVPVPTPNTTLLKDLAKVIRSKNAGPFEITFDVMFDNPATYKLVRDSGVLTRELLGDLYRVEDREITYCDFFEPALAFKFTFIRKGDQGGIGERDTFGAQQHAPFLDLVIPAGSAS